MPDKKFRIPLFCTVTSLYWFSLYAYVPTLSPYLKSLGISYKMVGLVVGSFGFSQMLFRIPLGILSDRINRRKIFVILGILLGGISSLGLWLFNDVIIILLFRLLAGVAAASWVTYTVLFSSYFKNERASKAIGIINSFLKIGQVVAMFLGGLAAQYYGQKAPFLVAAIGAVVGLFLSSGIVEKKVVDHEPLKINQLFQIVKNVNLLIVSGLAILFQLIIFATIFGFVPMVAKDIGASSFQLGMLATLATIPGIFSSAMSGTYFGNKFGEGNTIMAGFVILAFSCVVVPYIQSVYLLFVNQIIGGFAWGLVFPLLMGLSIKQIDENRRATAMGFFQAVYGIGMFTGPVLIGFISDMAGLTVGFWFVGTIGFIAAILAGRLLKSVTNFNPDESGRYSE